MKKTINTKKLKKKNTLKIENKKSQRSYDEDSATLSENEKENKQLNEANQYNSMNNDEDNDDNDYNHEQINSNGVNDPYQSIPKSKEQATITTKKNLTTLELQDLKIQQDLLDIAESARSKDSFGPWLPPPKQSQKKQNKNNEKSYKQSYRPSLSQKNIRKRPHSTHQQYQEGFNLDFPQNDNGINNINFQNSNHICDHQFQNSTINPICQDDYLNIDRNKQEFKHSLTQESIVEKNQRNFQLRGGSIESRKQIASVKNINFDDLEENNNIAKQSNNIFMDNQNDCQEGKLLYHPNKVFRMSPTKKSGSAQLKQTIEKRSQTQNYCECSSQLSTNYRLNTQQQLHQVKKNYFNTQNDNSYQEYPQIFSNMPVHSQPNEIQKNCYNMPLRTTLPRFLKNKGKQIKSDYNQYIKGHSQNNIYHANGTKIVDDNLKKNQEAYYQEISDLLNKTINTFNFNEVIDSNEADQIIKQASQVSKNSPTIKSKKGISPTKKLSLEQSNQQILQNKNAPQIKVNSKQQYRLSYQGGLSQLALEEKQRSFSRVDDHIKLNLENEEEQQQLQYQNEIREKRVISSSPSQTKRVVNKNQIVQRQLLLEIQQTTAATENTQGDITNRQIEKEQKHIIDKNKIPLKIKQANGSILTINPHAVLPLNIDEIQKLSQFNQKDYQIERKGGMPQQKVYSRPISQQKMKSSQENTSIDTNRQASIQFKLSYHRGKTLLSQQQNERQNLSVSGRNSINQNIINPQNQNTVIDYKNMNNSSAVQRKISQVLSQINQNPAEYALQQLQQNLAQSNLQNNSNKIQYLNTQGSELYEDIDEDLLYQQNHFLKEKNNKESSNILNLLQQKRRRVLSAQSNHPEEEQKRFSLQNNNIVINNNFNNLDNFNIMNIISDQVKQQKQMQAQNNNNNIHNSENEDKQTNNVSQIITHENVLIPRTSKSPFINYRRQLSNISQNQKQTNPQQQKIKKNMSFDQDLNIKQNLQDNNNEDNDNPKNFMNHVDAQLLFNTNALEFNGKHQSQEYQKKRQSYLKPGNSNNTKQLPKPQSQNKPSRQSTLIDLKSQDNQKLITLIDCKKIVL